MTVAKPFGEHFQAGPDAFRALAERALEREPNGAVFDPLHPPARGDHDLNPGIDPTQDFDKLRPAAVLVPVVVHLGEFTVLMTQRTDHLPSHAGQIAFPGGKMEPKDLNAKDTALRESEEEIGLARGAVDVIGYLDTYQTGTGFRIVPVVGLVQPGFATQIDPMEVAEIFEVPLAFLMDAGNHQRHSIVWKGRRRHYYAMPYENRYIWGATAGIIRNLHERLMGSWSVSSS